MNFNWKNEVVIVTGASSGLGRALAVRAGELHATVILIARSEGILAETGREIKRNGSNAFYFCFDLQNISQIPGLYKKIVDEVNKRPTILVNNVGYQVAGFVQNTPVEVYERNYIVNTLAPIALIQNVLPDMVSQKKGVIANVMSSIMYHAFPGVSSYCASKCALGAVHESLKLELADSHIKTLLIKPGSFRSNYWKNTDVGDRLKDYKLPSGEGGRDPLFVADRICKAIENGKEYLDLSTYKDKIGHHLSYWMPRLLEKIIVSRNRKLIDKYPL